MEYLGSQERDVQEFQEGRQIGKTLKEGGKEKIIKSHFSHKLTERKKKGGLGT